MRVALRVGALLVAGALIFVVVGAAGGAPRAKPSGGPALEGALAPGGVVKGTKSRSGRLAESDPDLLGRTDSTLVNTVVKLDYDSVAAYGGGIKGLPATSPEVTGKKLKQNKSAVDAYGRYIADVEGRIAGAIRAKVPEAQIRKSFRFVYGGLAVRLPANRIGDLLSVDGVVAVQEDALEQPLTDATPEFIGATQAWGSLGGSSRAGEGVIVGVLDTGVWPEHPSYQDPGISHPGGSYGCQFGDGSDPALGPSFTCNDKLIGAYAFLDTYMTFIGALPGEWCNNKTKQCSARDADGHGTHTSSTAAGSPVSSAPIFGIERGPISGIAPGAHVIMYRVCLDEGCFQSDSVDAVEQAIVDGADVLNFSISGGSNAFADPVELAFLDAYAAGILVNASAGNSGPGAATANHAGPWTNTVGASTSDRHFLTTLHMRSRSGATFSAVGATVTAGIADFTDVVRAGEVRRYGDELCQTPLPAGSVTGKVVVCRRGVVGRNEKAFNVLQGGGAGMILYNVGHQDLFTDNFWVPTVMLDGPSPANDLVAFLNANRGETAKWQTGTATKVTGDVMTTFSSRGPLGDWIKPDITAPGLQILAGTTPQPHPAAVASGPPGQHFQAIAGTSMSSPHGAGAAALVKDAHPSWTPGQIKSALMTSSVQDVLKEDGVRPSDPFDRGTGSIRANRATAPTATFDVMARDYFRAAGDPLGRINLNVASVNVSTLSGSVTVERTLRSVRSSPVGVSVVTQAPAGATIAVNPAGFILGAGASQKVRITIEAVGLAEGQYFGQITFDAAAGNDVVVPVAFFKRQGAITLTHRCDATTIEQGTSTGCTVSAQNQAPVPAKTELIVAGPADRALEIRNVSAPAVGHGPNGFAWRGTLSAALAPKIEAIEAGGSPFGYVSLASLGVAPLPNLGDEGGINFTVPAFFYGSEGYTRIGLTSNGYAVVGGLTADDIDFVPQTFPDPARPNNVLAPFWTDLDLSKGGNTYAAVLTDGTRRWIVLEWENVPTFSDVNVKDTFQIWVETAATAEGISYAFGATVNGPDPIGLTVGAENRDGSSGVNLGSVPAAGSDFSIRTSPPTPGGKVTITYDAFGRDTGTFDLVASLTSSVTAGTTTETVRISVTP